MAKYIFILDGTGAHHTRLVDFLNRQLPTEELLFLYCGPCCESAKTFGVGNALVLSSFFNMSKDLKEEIYNSSKIIIVGFFNVELSLFLYTHRALLKKTTVALHGGEFYGQRGKTPIKRKAFFILRRSLISKMEACCTFVPDDYYVAQKFYLLPKKHFLAELPWHFEATPVQAEEEKQKSPIVIMVGHNALKEDHTVEALQMLRKFKDEPIEIIAPLSYGDEKYKEKVIEKGKQVFGNKFRPLLEWIEPKEYQRLLRAVSVFVIGVDRQAGTFNINLMLRLGCKVYARPDTSIWSFFSNYCHCDMFSINDIESQEFEDFITFQKNDRVKNSRNLQQALNEETCLNSWKRILGITNK